MLTIQEIVLAFALIGVLGGWALGRVGARFGQRKSQGGHAKGDGSANHRVRALEADLRVAQRKAEEAELELERQREACEALRQEMQAKSDSLAQLETEARRLRRSLSEECGKTQGLRAELTQRVEESVRARVRVKDAETELSVARAGSEAVIEQIQRLAAERKELTGRLQTLQAEATRGGAPKVKRLPLRETKDR